MRSLEYSCFEQRVEFSKRREFFFRDIAEVVQEEAASKQGALTFATWQG